jgi:hypothetical protein
MKGYFKDFLIITLLCAIGAVLSAYYFLSGPAPISFWISFAFIAIASFAIHRILSEASEKRPQIFVAYFMGALTGKLFLSGILLIAVGLLDRENLKFTAIGFLVTYVLLTILEVRHLLPLMKNQNKE